MGRRAGEPGIGQAAVNQLLIEAAQSGQRVVRLKGGDAFVFGRGGEEVEALRQAGVTYSVVPGITAALGAAAEFEVPLTFRREALRVTFLTAHKVGDAETVDWSTLTDEKMTVVVYMGMTAADSVRSGSAGCGALAANAGRRVRTGDATGGAGGVRNARTIAGSGCPDRERPCGSHHRRRGGACRAMASSKRQSDRIKTAGSRCMTSPLEQKKIRITGPSMVTANRTWDGAVIYRTSSHGWSARLADAAIVHTSDEARALLAESVADDVGAIGAYIAPVEIESGGAIKPGNLREHIRSEGVTIDLPVPA